MKIFLEKIDARALAYFRGIEVPFARSALFLIYFWFGALKALGVSPAAPLVVALHAETIVALPFSAFYPVFAVFEMAIGALFLLRGAERLAIMLLVAHIAVTALPLALLSDTAWRGFLAPTLEGQYIIKNILIAALAVVVGAHIRPRSGNSTVAAR